MDVGLTASMARQAVCNAAFDPLDWGEIDRISDLITDLEKEAKLGQRAEEIVAETYRGVLGIPDDESMPEGLVRLKESASWTKIYAALMDDIREALKLQPGEDIVREAWRIRKRLDSLEGGKQEWPVITTAGPDCLIVWREDRSTERYNRRTAGFPEEIVETDGEFVRRVVRAEKGVALRIDHLSRLIQQERA